MSGSLSRLFLLLWNVRRHPRLHFQARAYLRTWTVFCDFRVASSRLIAFLLLTFLGWICMLKTTVSSRVLLVFCHPPKAWWFGCENGLSSNWIFCSWLNHQLGSKQTLKRRFKHKVLPVFLCYHEGLFCPQKPPKGYLVLCNATCRDCMFELNASLLHSDLPRRALLTYQPSTNDHCLLNTFHVLLVLLTFSHHLKTAFSRGYIPNHSHSC